MDDDYDVERALITELLRGVQAWLRYSSASRHMSWHL